MPLGLIGFGESNRNAVELPVAERESPAAGVGGETAHATLQNSIFRPHVSRPYLACSSIADGEVILALNTSQVDVLDDEVQPLYRATDREVLEHLERCS